MIPAILLGGWQAYQKLDDLTTKVAVIATKIDDHSKALAAIWKRLDETYEPAFSPGDPVKPQP
ncbi:MAG: hypothetical protein ACRDUW_23275 [Pseudonocardiaceae bacterium]